MAKKTIIHEMKLDKASFENLEKGTKTFELRLMDEKRQSLKLGEQIKFRLFPTLDHACMMEIIGLLHYPDFDTLLNDVEMSWLGLDDDKKDWQKNVMHQIYTPEEEKEYGVLGIRLQKVSQ